MFSQLNVRRQLSIVTISLIVIAVVIGCGSGASNNNQGASFLALGFFADGEGTTGSTGQIVPMFRDTAINADATGALYDGLDTRVYMGLQNNLAKQFIRVSRIDCDYSVDGSYLEIPSDSFPLSVVLSSTREQVGIGAVASAAASGSSSSFNQTSYGQFLIVSPDLYSFLNNNKAYLPALPFRMTATCSATGVTQAGDVLTTNSLYYFIQFVDEAECCTGAVGSTTPGFQNGPGTGGELVTTSTASPAASASN